MKFVLLIGFSLVNFCISTGCKKEDSLKDVDTALLFAPPTAEEKDNIRFNWSQRLLVPSNVKIEANHTVSQQLTLHIISYSARATKQFAGVLVPAGEGLFPVHVFISGFGLDYPISYQNIQLDQSGALPFVYVVPALRGQSLELVVNGITYKSEMSGGERNDAFDGAADDAIAAVNAAGILFAQADTLIVKARGGSRGATVAMLMGVRDRRVKRVVGVAGPTDFLLSTKEHQNDPTYKFQFLDELMNGAVTLTEARQKLIASSPLYFAEQLPKTQLHFGENDPIVPPLQGEMLRDVLANAGRQDSLQLYVYPGRNHDDTGVDNEEMNNRIRNFFE